jgi:hypothetical protein
VSRRPFSANLLNRFNRATRRAGRIDILVYLALSQAQRVVGGPVRPETWPSTQTAPSSVALPSMSPVDIAAARRILEPTFRIYGLPGPMTEQRYTSVVGSNVIWPAAAAARI